MTLRPPRSTLSSSSAASDVYKRQAYIYCDIIDTSYDAVSDTYIFTDLLADVIIENNGRVRVVDLDELGDALTDNIISCELMSDALHKLNKLLTAIYNGTFNEYIRILESHE